MTFKARSSFFVEGVAIQPTNETDVQHISLNLLLLVSELREGVNDNTEEDVKHDNDDKQVETPSVEELKQEDWSVSIAGGSRQITDTATKPETKVQHCEEALPHILADVFTWDIVVPLVDQPVVKHISDKEEANDAVDVKQDDNQKQSHH